MWTAGPWLLVAVLAKTGMYAVLIERANHGRADTVPFSAYQQSADSLVYTRLAENVLRGDMHGLDAAQPATAVSRMPGYSGLYLAPRLFLTETRAKTVLVYLQVLLDGICVVLVARLAGQVGGHLAFRFGFILYASSTFVSSYDSYILPDSPATSMLVCSVWLLLGSGSIALRPSRAALAGALFTWSYFMRPVLAPLGLLLAAYLLRPWSADARTRKRIAIAAAFSLPIVLAQSAWTLRNASLLGKFVPFETAAFDFHPADRAARAWIESLGGDIVFWRPGTLAAWMYEGTLFHDPLLPAPVPTAAMTPECPAEFLLDGRRALNAHRRARDAGREDTESALRAEQVFRTCRDSYEGRAPFDHWILSRVRLFKNFLVHWGAVLPLPRSDQLACPFSSGCIIRLWSAGIYAVTISLGILGTVTLLRRDAADARLIGALASYLVLVFPVLRWIETRYLLPAYPFLCVSAGVMIAKTVQWVWRRQDGGTWP